MSPSKKSKQPAADQKPEAAKENGATDVNEEIVVSDDEEEEQTEETDKSKAEESSAMDKLTDVGEEKQMDGNKMKEAFLALRKQEDADKEAERKR